MVKETKKTKKNAEIEKKVTKQDVTKKEHKNISKKKENKKVEKKDSKQKKVGLFKKIGNWFKSVIKEVSKVRWTSKKEMIKYSIATIVFIIFFALFFYAIELLMALLKSFV